jgi:DNA-binding transcriptional regulator GbsR (MarR family)
MPNDVNDAPSSFAEAQESMADGAARICRLYGVSPLVGRLYTQLLLSAEPLPLDALCERVGAAKSSVSVALRKLEAAKVARRLPPRLDRRDFYEAVTDPWAIFADWTKQFLRPELDMFEQTGAQVRRALDGASDAPTGDTAATLRARLDAFDGFGKVLGAMLAGVEARRAARGEGARRIPITVEDAP